MLGVLLSGKKLRQREERKAEAKVDRRVKTGRDKWNDGYEVE